MKGAKEHGIEANVQVEFGKPAEEIVRKAEREGVDLIVLSSTGKGVDRFLLGSVSEGVIRRAKCPVLVVPFSGPCTL
ncbi:MAG: universal stress protein [Candidatus Hydrothermarchaeota archaeon]